jgi:4'-phosphopantetheinyl transferase
MQHVAENAFVATAAPPPLGPDEIHVWHVALDATLKPREITAAAHALLTRLLMAYANVDVPPAIARTERGKPFAPSLAHLDFNLTHAREHVLIAVAREQPVGIDLERMDREIEIDDIARRYFSTAEADAIEALAPERKLAAFLRLWTCKEAVLKALGEGISFGLDRVAFALDATGTPERVSAVAAGAGTPAEWRLARVDPTPDYLGALAWRGDARRIRTFLHVPQHRHSGEGRNPFSL